MEIINIILLSSIPAILYSLVIYATVPYKIIDYRSGLYYLLAGFASITSLFLFFFAFPFWTEMSEYFMSMSKSAIGYLHFKNFIQIALIEELSKLTAFLLFERLMERYIKNKSHPLATMFYVGMVSLGFSIVENAIYGLGSAHPTETLAIRSVTSVIGHMVFGLFMGYWISLGRMGVRETNRSLFDIMVSKKDIARRRIFTIIGLLSATILHGLYDLHLGMQGNSGITTIYMLLLISLLGVFWCFRNLLKVHKF